MVFAEWGWGCLSGKKGEMVEGLRSCFGRVLLRRPAKTASRCSILIHPDFGKVNKLSAEWSLRASAQLLMPKFVVELNKLRQDAFFLRNSKQISSTKMNK